MEVTNIGTTQLAILKTLAQVDEPVTVGELAEVMVRLRRSTGWHYDNLHSALVKLEKNSLAARIQQDDDGKKIPSRWYITDDGRNTIGPALQNDEGVETPRPEAPLR